MATSEDETTNPVQAPIGVPPPPRPKVPGAQLIVNEVVIHQPTNGQAQELVPHHDGSFVRLTDTAEQPVRRDCTVGPDWQPLELWWLDGKPLAQIVVVNREGRFRGGNPTPEHRAMVLSRVIEVGVDISVAGLTNPDRRPVVVPFARVPPYESCRFGPAAGAVYVLRCPTGPAQGVVVAVAGD